MIIHKKEVIYVTPVSLFLARLVVSSESSEKKWRLDVAFNLYRGALLPGKSIWN